MIENGTSIWKTQENSCSHLNPTQFASSDGLLFWGFYYCWEVLTLEGFPPRFHIYHLDPLALATLREG